MTVSFTQTYGDNRLELYEIYFRDTKLKEFKNLFDLNIYAFHNSSAETIQKFKDLNTVNNTLIMEFNLPNYTDCIVELKKKLEEVGCTHFFFSQDDTFSADNEDIDLIELYNYMMEFDSNFMLDIFHNIEDLAPKRAHKHGDPVKIVDSEIRDTFTIFKSTTTDFFTAHQLAMDDSPYLCTIDALDKMYDDNYIAQKNVWDAEIHLSLVYIDGQWNNDGMIKIMDRYVTNKHIFRNYNLFGRSIDGKVQARNELIQKGLIES